MDSTYAPQSPDLSSFFSSPSKPTSYHPQNITSNSTATTTSSYTPQSPTIPSFNTVTSPAIPHQQQHHHHQQQQTGVPIYNHHQPQQPDYSQPHHPPFSNSHSFTANPAASPPKPYNNLTTGGRTSYDQLDTSNTQYQIPELPPQHSFPSQHTSQQPAQGYYTQSYADSPQSYTDPAQPSYIHPETQNFSNTYNTYNTSPISHLNDTSSIMSRHAAQPLAPSYEAQFPPQQAPLLRNPNPTNILITTKFPTARIKRIMQADEEVGKVAQVTPPAVNKALELFMIALVTGAAEKAKERGGKRITAQHLKQVVLGDEQFDFLAEIVGRVEEGKDEKEGGRKRKGKKEDSDSSDEAEKEKKKKGKGGRKKKGGDE